MKNASLKRSIFIINEIIYHFNANVELVKYFCESLMEKDLLDMASLQSDECESSFDCFQKTAAIAPRICYNDRISQDDLDCELQAKEGVLV